MSIRVIRPSDGAVIFDERYRIEQVDRPRGEPELDEDLVYLRIGDTQGRGFLVYAFPRDWVLGLTHTHVDEASVDCDGPTTHSHIERGGIDRTVNGYDLFLTYEGNGTFTKIVDDDHLYTIDIHAPTDEGWHAITFRECNSDSCNLDERTHRDVTAERAGY